MQLKNIPRYLGVILGIIKDERCGFILLTKLGRYLVPRYKFSWPHLAWFDKPTLNEILARYGEKDGFNAHRRLMIGELMRLTPAVPGDTAECGAYKGCGSHIILLAPPPHDVACPREHYVFDSFEGLSAPSPEDGNYWKKADLRSGREIIEHNLSEFRNVHFMEGWIPKRFDEVKDRRFAFVHIDVDLYEPTRDAIAFFYERLNPGAILICDDYALYSCPGATKAVDDFLMDKPEKMILLPGGGGFFIKGVLSAKE
ncbi:MAG: TylF/MycF family methyltransferase [Azoarcus sp.]|jgi:hypothetical protein|nr:TylF/MycF family methyltransferase [Azoarcus sp.]